MELVQMYEAACKCEREADFMSSPTSVLSTQGGASMRRIFGGTGGVYDSVLQLVQQPPPPVDFDQEIANRSFAEQRSDNGFRDR
jgi:hypothetical protein